MPLVWLILLEGYRLAVDMPAREFARLAQAGTWLRAIMPRGYQAAEPERIRLLGTRPDQGSPVTMREIPEYRRAIARRECLEARPAATSCPWLCATPTGGATTRSTSRTSSTGLMTS